ncbi:MAG: PaaI family thioesterase [Acidovorax sp.]|uniref:PaaI family thioesterase n=1 Tax=Acidovorax sp. TaxID=1872122 RepID=UPI0039E5500C
MTPEELALHHWKRRELPGFMGLAGPLWTRREGEAWAYAVLAQAAHMNPAGVMHGGALATLADHAISSVAWEACGRLPCVTLQLDTHFVGPVHVGELAQARARVVRRTGALFFMQGEVSTGAGVVLTAQALLKVIRAPQNAQDAGA